MAGKSKKSRRGSFLSRSRTKGKKLISKSGKRYSVKGAGSFLTFHSAKRAANRIAYGLTRKSKSRRSRRRR